MFRGKLVKREEDRTRGEWAVHIGCFDIDTIIGETTKFDIVRPDRVV